MKNYWFRYSFTYQQKQSGKHKENHDYQKKKKVINTLNLIETSLDEVVLDLGLVLFVDDSILHDKG